MRALHTTHHRRRLTVLSGVLATLLAIPAGVQADVTAAPTSDAPAAETPPPKPEIPESMRSPRAVLEAFVARMKEDQKKEAAKLLDLSGFAAIAADSRGPGLAFKLYELIPAVGTPPTLGSESSQRSGGDASDLALQGWGREVFKLRLDYSSVPTDPDRAEPYPLSEWLTRDTPAAEQIVIARDEQGRWRFDAETVAKIDGLYEDAQQRIDELAEEKANRVRPVGSEEPDEPTATFGVWLQKLFPPAWRKTHFLLPSYQWLLLGLLAPIGRLAEKLSRWLLTWLGDLVLGRVDPEFSEANETTAKVWRPVGRLAAASVWVVGAYLIELPSAVTNVLLTLLMGVAIVAVVLALFRVLDLIADYLSRRAKRRNRKFDDLIVPLLNTTAKVVVVLLSILWAVAVFNDQLPSTLIGGLGIGGIAIALASQETLSNFFGSLTLLFDRPFEVGDWVHIEGVEGEVERLGFRSTRIRTGLNSQVTVPNSKLAGANVDNLGRRKYRRYLSKLGLEYGTPPERIDAFCEGIVELIRRHPHTRKDFYAARFNDFGASSLDVLVVCYFEVGDWATELRERHRLLSDILRLAESVGVSFAFPTQTLHLHRGEDDPKPLPPPEIDAEQPKRAGAKAAADIAGELPNYQDRPGKVKFPGPTSFQ